MTQSERVAWVDIAKGISIVLIVTLHATLGVEKVAGAEGYMNDVVDFARPFRAPTFFLLAGLFLSRTIDRDRRSFLDAKVVHFGYFYVLWLAIQAACKSPHLASGELSFLELSGLKSPAGTLWYIYMLPVFFVTTRLLRRAPPRLLLGGAALLQVFAVITPVVLVQEFMGRYVFFVAGYVGAGLVFAHAEAALRRPTLAAGLIGLWAVGNWLAVDSGLAAMRGLSLVASFAGIAAMVAVAALISRAGWPAAILRFIGQRSLSVYLAFFIPAVVARVVLAKLGPDLDPGTASLITVVAGLGGALLLRHLVDGTLGRYLFERPAWARLARRPHAKRRPAISERPA